MSFLAQAPGIPLIYDHSPEMDELCSEEMLSAAEKRDFLMKQGGSTALAHSIAFMMPSNIRAPQMCPHTSLQKTLQEL